MAYRRRRRYKRRQRRVFRRARVSKHRAAGTMYGGMIHPFKLKFQYQLASSVAGDIQDWVSVHNPTGVIKGTGTVGDWSSVSSMFDLYKVKAVKYRYTPQMMNEVHATIAYRPLYSVYDMDSQPLFTISDFIQYDSLKVFNMMRPFSHYHKVQTAINTGGVTTKRVGSWIDIASPQDIGTMAFYTNNLTPSTVFGDVVITYYIFAKSRR